MKERDLDVNLEEVLPLLYFILLQKEKILFWKKMVYKYVSHLIILDIQINALKEQSAEDAMVEIEALEMLKIELF